jgi:anti-sigma factor RsiW
MLEKMVRFILAVAVVLLAVGAVLVGYNILVIGTGLASGVSLLGRYWRDFISEPSITQSIQWMAIIVAALMLAWRAGVMREPGR